MGNQITITDENKIKNIIMKGIKEKEVDLRNNGQGCIGDAGVEFMMACPDEQIASLSLAANKITMVGVKMMTKGCWLNLASLNIWNNQIGNMGSKYLTRCSFEALVDLNIAKNEISTQGIIHISKCTWKKLSKLNIFNNKIAEGGIKFLLKARTFELTFLNINLNWIQCEDLLQLCLIEAKGMTHIEIGKQRPNIREIEQGTNPSKDVRKAKRAINRSLPVAFVQI